MFTCLACSIPIFFYIFDYFIDEIGIALISFISILETSGISHVIIHIPNKVPAIFR